jgi:hypothetical protein
MINAHQNDKFSNYYKTALYQTIPLFLKKYSNNKWDYRKVKISGYIKGEA